MLASIFGRVQVEKFVRAVALCPLPSTNYIHNGNYIVCAELSVHTFPKSLNVSVL